MRIPLTLYMHANKGCKHIVCLDGKEIELIDETPAHIIFTSTLTTRTNGKLYDASHLTQFESLCFTFPTRFDGRASRFNVTWTSKRDVLVCMRINTDTLRWTCVS